MTRVFMRYDSERERERRNGRRLPAVAGYSDPVYQYLAFSFRRLDTRSFVCRNEVTRENDARRALTCRD